MKYKLLRQHAPRLTFKRAVIIVALLGASLYGIGIYGYFKYRDGYVSKVQTTEPTPVFEDKPVDPKEAIKDSPFDWDINILTSETNRNRAEAGLPPVSLYEPLNRSAQAKCDDMVKRDYWAHVAPDGTQPWYFFSQHGISYQKAGENLAYGHRNEYVMVQGWMDSPSHKENILTPEFTKIGFGVCESPNFIKKGEWVIVVQHFAQL